MTWADADLKIFAAGLAIGGKWNHTFGTLPRVKSTVESGTYWYTQHFTLYSETPDADIYFSILGRTPFQKYVGQSVYIDNTMTVLAYVARGQGLSLMSRFDYVIAGPLVTSDILNASNNLVIIRDEAPIIDLNTIILNFTDGGINFTIDLLACTDDKFSIHV